MRLTVKDCERAKELLDNKFFDVCVQQVHEEIAGEWRRASSEREREDLWREQRLISRLKGRLLAVANDSTFQKRALQSQDRG